MNCKTENEDNDLFCGGCGHKRVSVINVKGPQPQEKTAYVNHDPVQGMKEIESFIKPGVSTIYIGGVLLLFGIFSSYSLGHPGVLIFMLAVAVLINIVTWRDLQKWKESINKIQETGLSQEVVTDFHRARSYFGGELRLGDRYIFGKKSARVLKYSDLRNVYQYIHKTNFVEDSREFRGKTVSDETVEICKMQVRGKSDAELMTVVTEILKKNNRVTVGYNK